MSLQATMDIDVDFYDKKYILINVKQHDKISRFLSITCYNHGEIFPINSGEHSAYIRYKKPDNNSVFNFCDINHRGKIIVVLTEQMLASEGICCADLVIVNKGEAGVNSNTGEIRPIDKASVLSTMKFYIDVSETAVLNSEIESSYEFDGLNEALERAEAEYTRVIQLSKSYATGDANGIRANEKTDNAKYYSQQSSKYSNSASKSEANALNSYNLSKSYAVGTTGIREGEDVDNAKYYYNLTKNIIEGLNNVFLPMGTISFSELSKAEKAVGYIYNIKDNFVTDDTFKEGAGKPYNAGTNVYYTADNYWDCFGGAASPIATVNEIREYLNI